MELDIKQVLQSPDHEGAVTSVEFAINAAQRAGKGQYARRMVDPQDFANFGWKAVERIQRTLENSTQNFKAAVHIPFRKHYKSRFPGANVTRIQEWWSTDDIKVDQPMPEVGVLGLSGRQYLQVFTGLESGVIVVYPMKSKSEFPWMSETWGRTNPEQSKRNLQKIGARSGS